MEITIKVKMSRFSISDKEFISFSLYATNFHFYSLQFMFHEFIKFDIYGVRTLISKIRYKHGHVNPVYVLSSELIKSIHIEFPIKIFLLVKIYLM